MPVTSILTCRPLERSALKSRAGRWQHEREMIVFTFSETVTSADSTATGTYGRVNSTRINGSTVTVELGHVTCDGSDITVTVSGVTGASCSVDASVTRERMGGQASNLDGSRLASQRMRIALDRAVANDSPCQNLMPDPLLLTHASPTAFPVEGGGLYGGVRNRLHGAAKHRSDCHCQDCRRASAAPYAVGDSAV